MIEYSIEYVKNLKKIDKKAFYINIVYFLLKDDEVVYVGHTTQGFNRILEHVKQKIKDFDSFSYIECEENELFDVENKFINILKPKYNQETLPEFPLFKESDLKKLLKDRVNTLGFNKLLKENSIEPLPSNRYYRIFNINDFIPFLKVKYIYKYNLGIIDGDIRNGL